MSELTMPPGSAPRTIVIAGAGHGGVHTAAALRHNGFDGRIVLIGNEEGLPYQRPPLSKAYLQGKMPLDTLWLKPESFYRDNRIELLGHARVAGIAPRERRLTLGSGETLAYDHLVLALGARNRLLPLPGADLDGVAYIRTLAETDALKPRLAAARDIVIIGAGFIGLEFAAVAAAQGKTVTVLEMTDRVMSRVVSPVMSQYFADWHAQGGARFRFAARATQVIGEAGRAVAVTAADGTRIPADLVVVSIGVVPNVELARDAGLAVGDGIVVDEMLRTADPAISAIGDCAFFPSLHGRRALRLESVQNAHDQGKAVADRLTGKLATPDARYAAVPWFWSDQGDRKLQIVGIANGHDRTVIRGDVGTGAFSVFCYAGGDLLAIESVNRPGDHMFGRRAMAAGLQPTPEQAADPTFDLKKFLQG
ncbi:MAG TPA: FAD-dependent oxidoreductase [Pseudolabrys sp.]|nr:FAD-dependent oxidoreductase [Pseudolabrys sp.]